MTRIYALLFAVALTFNACATAGPIAIKCGLQDVVIAANDYAEIKADIQSKNWTDLAKLGESLGWATLDCVLGNEASKSPAVKANVDEFRRLHSVEFRSAGGSACRDSRPSSPAGAETSGTGGKITLSACDAKCGKPLTGLATHGRCMCWRESKTDWRASRWVAAR